ncbi:hypothetical protein [Nitrosomonas marina]|uniref:Uncharacterized protein n=1 Tax=Nitrosomonas marina TaxID=917 RepID=A0A1H8IRM5_9PROT|nr:hypothetical protein [Nitrosomonas marina]SEN71303.1 hypothetical protein SAMN05216325_13915 [Nitrosomonas marina]
MAIDTATSNAGRRYTIPIHPDFYIPNSDFFRLLVWQMNSVANYGYIASIGGSYGEFNTVQIYNDPSNGLACKIHTLGDSYAGGGALSAGVWYIGGLTRRGGNYYSLLCELNDPEQVSEGSGVAISSGYLPSGTDMQFGLRSDLTSDATYAFNGRLSDAIFVNGFGLTQDDLVAIAAGKPLHEFDWWDRRALHAHFKTSAVDGFMDLTGRHPVTRNGAGYGANEIDPQRLIRSNRPESVEELYFSIGGLSSGGGFNPAWAFGSNVIVGMQ